LGGSAGESGFIEFATQGRCSVFLSFAGVIQGDIADHLCHPCPEVGAWLKLIQLPQREQRCLLNDILRPCSVSSDPDGDEPEGTEGSLELRSEVQWLLGSRRSVVARWGIPVCPSHVTTIS